MDLRVDEKRTLKHQLDLEAQNQDLTRAASGVHPSNPCTAASIASDAMSSTPPTRKPWEDAGYPKLCRDSASADNFLCVRRFNALHARTLLQLQDEIVVAEERLEDFDNETRAETDARSRHLGSMRLDPLPERQDLLRGVRKLLSEYDNLLLSHSQLRERPSADKAQTKQIRRWVFTNHIGGIRPEEAKFLDTGVDLVPLVSRPKGLVMQWMEEHLTGKLFSRIFRVSEKAGREPDAHYSSNRGLKAFIAFAAVLFALVSMIVPMWILTIVSDSNERLGIITGFMVFFALILTAMRVNEPGQAMIGTAAYAAVLMVYQQGR